jgi:hypothetical protein
VLIEWLSELVVKSSIFLATYTASNNIYCDWTGRIFTSLNKLQHEVLLWEFVIILMTLFCNLNTSSVSVELPQNIMPYVVIEWIYEKYIVFKLFTDKAGLKVLSTVYNKPIAI